MAQAVRTLIADDHAPLRAILREDLEERGFAVVGEACDAHSAVQLALKEKPELCLLDVGMPGGGLSAAWHITAATDAPRVVMLTSSRAESDMVAAVRAGAVGYLLKDLDADLLAQELRDLVDGEVLISHSAVTVLLEASTPRRWRRLTGRGATFDADERRVLEALGRGLTLREIAFDTARPVTDVRSLVASVLGKVRAPTDRVLRASAAVR